MRLVVVFSMAILLLVSCDPVVVYQYGITYKLVNSTDSMVYMRFKNKNFTVKSEIDSKQEMFVNIKQTDDYDIANMLMDYDSFFVGYTSECLFDITNIINSKNYWFFCVYDGSEMPEKPIASEYEFWYDYTFVITDSMLKKE